MHFYRVCWNPLMGMSCFLVQNCTHFTKVSCFSVHFRYQLSPISCFARFFVCFCTSVCDSVLMCCSLWQGVLESSWYFNAIFWCFLRAVYGNAVFFPGKGLGPGFSLCCRPSALDRTLNLWARRIFCMHFYWVFWRWGDFCMHFYRLFWLPSYGNVVFSRSKFMHFSKVSCFSVHFCSQLSQLLCFVCIFCILYAYLCDWCLCVAVCGRQFLSRVDILMHVLRCFLRAVYGNIVFFRSKTSARHKSLVFFRSILLTAVTNLMFC